MWHITFADGPVTKEKKRQTEERVVEETMSGRQLAHPSSLLNLIAVVDCTTAIRNAVDIRRQMRYRQFGKSIQLCKDEAWLKNVTNHLVAVTVITHYGLR